jgi:hypothetical protein
MAGYNKFHKFIADVHNGVHNLSTNTIKVYLTLTAPSQADDAVKADLAEITAENGYAAGGVTIPITSSAQTGGNYELDVDETPIVITAAGGTVGPFRYAVCYNDTAANDPLISFFDYGSALTLNDGEKLNITPSDNLFVSS